MSSTLSSLAPWAALTAVLLALLALDLKLFARGREPTFREGAAWSIGWLVLSLLAAGVSCASPGDFRASPGALRSWS